MEKHTRTKTLLIFAAAFLIRLAYTLWLEWHDLFAALPGSDVLYYREWAYDIAAGRGTQGPFYGLPLYPYFLAMLFRLFGDDLFFIRLIHLFIGSVNCVLGYLLCRKIFVPDKEHSEKTALLTGILMTGNFSLIYYDWLLMPVGIIIMLSFAILFLAFDFEKLSKLRTFSLGVLLGITALADGKILIFLFLLSFFFLWKNRHALTATLIKVILVGLGCLLMLSPVVLHNRAKSGDWILITAQSGFSFYVGNRADTSGFFENPEFIRPSHRGQDTDIRSAAESAAGRRLSDKEVMDHWQKRGMDFITGNPREYGQLLVRKFRAFFTAAEQAAGPGWVLQRPYRDLLDINPFWLMCPLALIGTAAFRRRDPVGPAVILIISQLFFTLIFFLNARHRAGVIPFFIIFESAALIYVFSAVKHKNFRPLAGTAAVLVFYLWLFPPKKLSEAAYRQLYASKAGIAYEREGKWEKAIASYRRALELRPGDTNAQYNLATAYLKTGETGAAESLYHQILTAVPHQPDVLFNLGMIYEERGETGPAMDFYRRALATEPGGADIHFRISGLLVKAGRCAEARPHIRHLLKAHPALTPELRAAFSACPDAFLP